MAKSIYILMNDRQLDVTNGKDQFTVTLPEWIPTGLSIEDCQKMINEVGIEAIVGKALSQIIIDLRSIARATADKKEDIQKAIEEYVPEAPRKPQTAKSTAEKATDLFKGMTPEQIKQALKEAGLA